MRQQDAYSTYAGGGASEPEAEAETGEEENEFTFKQFPCIFALYPVTNQPCRGTHPPMQVITPAAIPSKRRSIRKMFTIIGYSRTILVFFRI